MKKNIIFPLLVGVFFLLLSCSESKDESIAMDGLSDMGYLGSYNEKYKDYGENAFVKTNEIPVSTFSVDADGASYSNMRRYINLGQLPPKESIRIEEFINYFTFNYPEPANGENISLDTEIATCPWLEGHLLLRIGIKGKKIPESELQPSNYVFLIDVSGSMDSPDKLGILKTGFNTLVDNLSDKDRIAIVTYAGSAGVVLPSTSCNERDIIHAAINKLDAGGSTAGAEGIVTAYEIAMENYIADGNNRIILGTDGDFNVGVSSAEELVKLIETKRDNGIYITVLGVGGGNLNDHMMEQVANKGNGTYEYIDNVEQIQKVFVNERAKFYSVAKDCKIQVTFNPEAVDSYRLIGYENRKLETEDFEDDNEDAGEIGVGQTITALYEIIPVTDNKSNSYAQLDVRYKKPEGGSSILLSDKIDELPALIENSSENMRFATAATAFGLLMRQSEYKGTADINMVLDLAKNATGFDPFNYRKEFIELVNKVNL